MQKINSKFIWKDPEILKDIVSNEIVVAGVYLRLFVSNPAWTLRKPKQFLSDLLDFVVDQISKSSSEVRAIQPCCCITNYFFFLTNRKMFWIWLQRHLLNCFALNQI